MVLVKAIDGSEKDFLLTTEPMEAMGKFNDELRNAGIRRPQASSHGKRIAFDGPGRAVIDGPLAETRASGSGKSRTWTRRSPG
jgi:hypothetical protein